MEWIEFETKYEVEETQLYPFKKLMEDEGVYEDFTYVQGTDYFYTFPNDEQAFARYRKADHGDGKRAEFTVKKKHDESNSFVRTETNWRVDKTPEEEIHEAARLLNLEYNTYLWKASHIYKVPDAVIAFYSVRVEDSDKLSHFVAIEVKHDKFDNDEERWQCVRSWEDKLAPIGINAQKRKRKSLFEMVRK